MLRNPLIVALCLSSSLTVILLGAIVLLPQPETVFNITAQTETLAFRVVNPDAVAMQFENARLHVARSLEEEFEKSTESTSAPCVSGRFKPLLNNKLRYHLGSDGVVTIAIEDIKSSAGAAIFNVRGAAAEHVMLATDSLVILDPNDKRCQAVMPAALPIWGPAELGRAGSSGGSTSATPGFLYKGNAEIYARTLSFFRQPGLYKAGEIGLPAGSRITQDGKNNEEEKRDNPLGRRPWFGSARIPRSSDTNGEQTSSLSQSGFDVYVSTDATELHLYRAGLKSFEVLRVSSFARQFKDPGLLRLQLLAGIVVAIFTLVATYVALVRENYNTG